ncbi:hypothetical protein AC1031_012189 [Aphanomyces cochlioides]|nr:hypothetical protein AC1031_012189 [Aphanomyces cochlioides]
MMLQHGVSRDANAIKTSKFQKAEDWKNSTGAGLRDIALSNNNKNMSDDELNTAMAERNATIQKAILEICPQYVELSPVFGTRPLSRPVFHSSTDEPLEIDQAVHGDVSEVDDNSDFENVH